MNNNYCPDIHHNLAIDYMNGEIQVGPCCQSGRINASQHLIDRIWTTKELEDIRQQNLNGQLFENFCSSCTRVESTGNRSRRHSSLEFYKDWDATNKKIRGLDIKLGNLCNLKCTICGPAFSSAWLPDAEKLGRLINNKVYYNKSYMTNLNISFDNPDTLQDLEMIKFWGGEPLINEVHAGILEDLDKIDVLKNCRVVYNTNGTHRVSQRVLDLWSKAKLIELYFSIDDIGLRFDYQRFGADWNKTHENLNWYYDNLPSNHLFYFQTTVSYLNFYYLPELFEWKTRHFNTNRMGDETQILLQPAVGFCAIDTIASTVKKKLEEKFKPYPVLADFLTYSEVAADYKPQRFLEYVAQLDSIRNTSYQDTFPEFAQIL